MSSDSPVAMAAAPGMKVESIAMPGTPFAGGHHYNVFLRGEWEYVKFMSIKDTIVTQNSVHAGIGYKF